MLYFGTIILLFLGLILRKSKIMMYILILFMIFLTFGGNDQIADRIYYQLNYDYLSQGINFFNFEMGYNLFVILGIKLGLSYNQFFLISWGIGILLLSNTMKKFTQNYTYVLVLYFIYPFIWDTVQIRNFLAMSIIVYGLRYLLSENKSYFKYFISVLIASTVHITALFYLLFFLNKIEKTSILFKLSLAFTLVTGFFMSSIINIIGKFVSVEKIIAYTQTNTSFFTKFMVIIYFSFGLALVYCAHKLLAESNKRKAEDFKYKKPLIDGASILRINIISMIALGFVMNNLNFFRLYRNFSIINYILFAETLFRMKKDGKYYLFYILILFYVILSFIVLVKSINTTDIVTPLFERNFVFPF